MPEITVRQEEIEAAGHHFTVTHIPTATSGSWYTVHDVCEVWGAVAIDDINGTVIGWRNPPGEEIRTHVEEAIKKAFSIPVEG